VVHVPAQVRQLAEAKEAELNARVLQLESHIHWLSQDNQRLQEELQQAQQSAAEGAAAAQAAAAGQQQKAAAADLAVSVTAAALCHVSRH
jgi:septal ring factor EnvC (AmiA/AmiB activator)